jgi:hypothetical protein
VADADELVDDAAESLAVCRGERRVVVPGVDVVGHEGEVVRRLVALHRGAGLDRGAEIADEIRRFISRLEGDQLAPDGVLGAGDLHRQSTDGVAGRPQAGAAEALG